MTKTIWFINPPDYFLDRPGDRPPLGLAVLSAYIKQYNCSTRIWDGNHEIPTLRDLVEWKPDFICIAVNTPTYNKAIEIANSFILIKHGRFKRMFSRKLKLVAGGVHVSAYPSEELTLKVFDYIVTGTDGEEALYRIIFGKAESQIIRSKDIENLDMLPFPDYEGLNLERYDMLLEGKKAITMSTSRGCVYSCFYCGSASIKKFRAHSAEYVVRHMKYIYDKYDFRAFYFVDDIFTFKFDRVFKICELIKKEFPEKNILIRATTRSNLLTQEMCYIMKDAGFDIISLGLESGSDKVLKAMLKHETVEIQRKGVEYCFNAGIKVKGFFIIGNPEETWEDVLMTINFAKDLTQKGMLNYADCYILNPIPAAPFWNNPEKFGMSYEKPVNSNWETYYQIGKGRDIKVHIKHPYLSEEQLKEGIRLFYEEVKIPGLTYQ